MWIISKRSGFEFTSLRMNAIMCEDQKRLFQKKNKRQMGRSKVKKLKILGFGGSKKYGLNSPCLFFLWNSPTGICIRMVGAEWYYS